ncbi:MAG: hypothetical protein PHC43_04975 [Candidatus Marinimicrobia bacterium]|nr:hypothetical protein [Candidatus Neomarinimicrobiota bacterium]MDD5060989.1 hypothetical protein [Candidatus Neomarinimicrobiota bacterium]MDD5230659.1 hypothetical protein [Candidatus Neomarinimicrobiota bacterium]MDD5539256.1 hypothetical protein [Candidatus Neomarinimicrobiota bacterium]
MNLIMRLALIALIIISIQNLSAQQKDTIKKIDKVNAIAIGPMGDIFIVQYGRKISKTNELIVGASYTNPEILNVIKYPGTEQILTLELGYRKYLWRNLHAEIQIDPQYFNCKDTIENKTYNGFGLTPEIRLGYRFDFKIKKLPLFINLQWFAGYHLINPKPERFKKVDGGSLYISPIPMFFIGLKF